MAAIGGAIQDQARIYEQTIRSRPEVRQELEALHGFPDRDTVPLSDQLAEIVGMIARLAATDRRVGHFHFRMEWVWEALHGYGRLASLVVDKDRTDSQEHGYQAVVAVARRVAAEHGMTQSDLLTNPDVSVIEPPLRETGRTALTQASRTGQL